MYKMADSLADYTRNFSRNTEELMKSMAKAKQVENGYANIFYEQLVEEINEFDKSLDHTQEVGIRLVSYGNTIQFHITNIGYQNPYLIYFYGELEDGSPIQLIQHVSQISFVLMAMKRKDPEQPKRNIGF
jgi:hypothetical protein